MAVGTTAFPTSLDTAVELVEIKNNASSTLSGAVLIGDVTIGVTDIAEFPTTGFGTLTDDLTTPTKTEIISWTGISGSNLTGCTRGTQGTSAAAFSSGNYIEVRPTAGHHEALRGAVIAIETKIGSGSAIAVNKLAALTASRLMVTDASGFASVSSATSTEAGYLSGVTSAIQTQLNAKGAGDALVANPLSQFAATTSLQLAGVISDETGSGALVFGTSPVLTTPDINGGTADSLTSLSVRSTGAAFDLLFANTEVLTGNKTLTFTVNDTNRTVDLAGNLTLAAAFSTSGANALTLTTTGATNVTLPTTGTLVNSAVTSLSSLTTVGTITSGGLGTGAVLGGVTMTLGSDADGDIYYRSSNVLTRLAKGTALQQLRMNAGATAPEWATIASGGGLTIGTTAITSGTAGRILYETSGNVVGEIAGSAVTAEGAVTIAPSVRSSGVASYFAITTPADTGITTATESVGAYFGGNGSGATVTRTWAAGTVASQSENVFVAPTYAGASATATFTRAATVKITGSPIAGSNAVITNPRALELPAIAYPYNSLAIAFGTSQNGFAVASNGDAVYKVGPNIVWAWSAGGGQIQINDSYSFGWSGTPTGGNNNTGFARAAAGIVRVTNGMTGAGKLIIGTSSASTTAADLYVVGSSSSLVPLRVDSAATPSVNIFETTVNGGAGTGFVVTSAGSPSSTGGATTSERFGAGSTITSTTNGYVFGTNSTINTSNDSIAIGRTLTVGLGGTASKNILISPTGGYIGNSSNVIVIGFATASNGINNSALRSIIIGELVAPINPTDVVMLNGSTTGLTNNSFIVGGASGGNITNWYGNGVASATPVALTINGTGGSGSNIAGADVIIAGGKNTGSPTSTATGNVRLATSIVGAAASTLNTLVDRLVIANRKTLTDASTNLFEVALPTLKGCMGTIRYEIYASDGTDIQVRRGQVQFSAVNKAGSYTTEIAILNEAVSASTGTLTAAWGITGGTNKVTIDVTPTGSLTETTYYILYTIENNSEQAITIL